MNNKIKNRRKHLGLSQSKLSMKANVPIFIVQRYENDKANRKPIEYALKLAKALNCDADYLFT